MAGSRYRSFLSRPSDPIRRTEEERLALEGPADAVVIETDDCVLGLRRFTDVVGSSRNGP